jgi:hypothetical protein
MELGKGRRRCSQSANESSFSLFWSPDVPEGAKEPPVWVDMPFSASTTSDVSIYDSKFLILISNSIIMTPIAKQAKYIIFCHVQKFKRLLSAFAW